MAAPGDLDTSFDGDGKRAINFGGTDSARAVLVQPNGRIVVAGDGGPASSFCVARLRTNGATFGNAVALQPNGRIVAAGQRTGGDDFAVARLLGLS